MNETEQNVFKNKACDDKLMQEGTRIFAFHDYNSAKGPLIEAWVKKIAEISQAKVDWYITGKIAFILTLAKEKQLKLVYKAIEDNTQDIKRLLDQETKYTSPTPPTF